MLRIRPLPPFSWDGLSPSAVSPLVGADVKPQSYYYYFFKTIISLTLRIRIRIRIFIHQVTLHKEFVLVWRYIQPSIKHTHKHTCTIDLSFNLPFFKAARPLHTLPEVINTGLQMVLSKRRKKHLCMLYNKNKL